MAPEVQKAGVGLRGPAMHRGLLRMDQAAAAVLWSGHLLVMTTQWSKAVSGLGQLHMLAVSLNLFTSLAVMTWCPVYYWRNRLWLLPVLRTLAYCVPSARQVGVGSTLIMERSAQAGPKGAFLDFMRVVAGTRLLPTCAQGLISMLPPSVALLTQVVLSWLSANSSGYCSTELMLHPLSQQRMATAAKALEYVSLPLLTLQPVPAHLSAGGAVLAGQAPPDAVCRATVSFLHVLLGVLVPCLLSVYCWRQAGTGGAPSAARLAPARLTKEQVLSKCGGGDAAECSSAEAAAHAEKEEEEEDNPKLALASAAATAAAMAPQCRGGATGSSSGSSGSGSGSCLAAWAAAAARRCDGMLQLAASTRGLPAARAVLCWLLLVHTWQWTKLAAGL